MLTATKPEARSESVPELRARWKELLPSAQLLAKQTGDLKTLAQRLSNPDGYASLKKLQKDLEKLRVLEIQTEALVAGARQAGGHVEEWLALEWNRRGAEFTGDLQAFFAERSIPAELDGMVVKAGLFHIVIEPEKDRARLCYLDEDITELKLSCEGIFKVWQSTREAMEKAATAPSSMASVLLESYDDQCRLQGKSAGTRIRLCDLHFQAFVARQTSATRQNPLQKKIKDYPRYQFAYDLSNLIEREADGLTIAHEGRHLIFHPASSKAATSRTASVKIEHGKTPLSLSDLEVSG